MRFMVSQIKLVFILLSRAEDEESDGHMLTSINHGFSLWSMRISKPYIS